MADSASDETFARTIHQMGAVTLADIDAAKAAQATAAQQGALVSLAEVMVQSGLITPAMRESVEKHMQVQQAGGVQQLGQYKLLKKLGEGWTGAVYLAEDTFAQRKVAVKVLARKHADDPEFLKRFRREARAAGQLNHANIVGGYTVGEELGYQFLVMEYCEGDPLEVILARERVLPWDRAVEIVSQIARGLQHAHDHGFIHRDIKPGNIFITTDGVAKILDLGMSKEIADTAQFTTQSGVALGTPHYISPEQARGERKLDGRTDIYSLGATLYHLVTGTTPFQGPTSAVIMTKHLNEQLPDPRDIRADIPDGVVQVIGKMMAKDPADRYGDCAELLADLELVQNGRMPGTQALEAEKSSVTRRAPGPSGRRVETRTTHPQQPVGTRPQQAVGTRPQEPVERRSKRAARSPKRKQLQIAAGVLVAGALIFVVALLTNGEPDAASVDPGTGKAVNDTRPPERPSPEVTPAERKPEISKPEAAVVRPPAKPEVPAVSPTAAVDDSARWRKAINLLPLVDVQKAAVAGTWKTDNGMLVSDTTGDPEHGGARVEIPFVPPEEYDLRVVFTRIRVATADGGGDIVHILPRSGRQFAWVMGAFGNSVLAFETVNGERANTNPTCVKRSNCLQSGRSYTSVVSVRRDGVKAYLDGALVSQLKTDYKDVTLEPAWKLRSSDVLGLATYGSPTMFERVELLEVTGKGRTVQLSEVAAKPPEAKTSAGGEPAAVTPPATEAAAAPALDLTSRDIGTTVVGSTKPVGADGYDIASAGDDIWNARDSFRFVYRQVSGDFEIRARVVSVQRTHEWAKAGLMVRQSTTPGAIHAALNVTPEHGCMFQRRIEPGGECTFTDGGPYRAGAAWVRLTRSGKAVTAYVAADEEGQKWKRVGSEVLEIKDPVVVGLCVSSHGGGTLCTAAFRNLTLTAKAEPQK